MKITALILLTSALSVAASGQTTQADTINAMYNEGKILYQLEQASWTGSNMYYKQHGDMLDVGGYFSYLDSGRVKNVFYSQALTPKVITEISFDGSFRFKSAKTYPKPREFTKTEQCLFVLREKARSLIKTDSLFKPLREPISILYP